MTKFDVIDSLMGSGKTQYIIQMINESDDDKRFIYITPYLDEVARVKESVTNRTMYEPDNETRAKTKLDDLKNLIRGGLDIVSTHQLFRFADMEVIQLLEDYDYHLIIDEALDVIETVDNMTRGDVELLYSIAKMIDVDDKGRVRWLNEQIGENTQYESVYLLAKAQTLYMVGRKAFVKMFNDKLLRSFQTVTVCTYLFKYSQMRMYYDTLNIQYDTKAVTYDNESEKYKLIDYDPHKENRKLLHDLMTVYEGKYNDNIKDVRLSTTGLKALSTTEEGREQLNTISKNIRNFFLNHRDKEKGAEYWSTIKDMHKYIRPQSFLGDDCRMSISEKATNKYADGYAIAYIYDRYPNPNIRQFFTGNGVEYNSDGWAISDMLQWIFRSRIRNSQDIQLYLPSKRMRMLLKAWANYEL